MTFSIEELLPVVAKLVNTEITAIGFMSIAVIFMS